MYCKHCGAQQPDNGKFCSNCGGKLAEDQAAAKPEPQNPPPQQKQQAATPEKKKGKLSWWVGILIVLAAFLLGKFVIAPSMAPDSDPSNSGTQSQTGGNAVANPAYEKILTEAYIVHFQTFFNLETENYVLKQEDGTIICDDYGCEGDVVKQWVETAYIPISGYTDAEKTELETAMRTGFASIDALNCCTVTYRMSANYFTITCTYSNVDQASNYSELYNAGIIEKNSYISMSVTETVLFSQGFIKK